MVRKYCLPCSLTTTETSLFGARRKSPRRCQRGAASCAACTSRDCGKRRRTGAGSPLDQVESGSRSAKPERSTSCQRSLRRSGGDGEWRGGGVRMLCICAKLKSGTPEHNGSSTTAPHGFQESPQTTFEIDNIHFCLNSPNDACAYGDGICGRPFSGGGASVLPCSETLKPGHQLVPREFWGPEKGIAKDAI
jgi:hypothetical protein